MDSLNFKLKLKEKDVVLDDKKFKLKELTAEQKEIYTSFYEVNLEMVDGKRTIKLDSFKSFPPAKFVSMSLYDEADSLVPIKEIEKFPAEVVSKLYSAALTLSGLTPESEEEVKND